MLHLYRLAFLFTSSVAFTSIAEAQKRDCETFSAFFNGIKGVVEVNVAIKKSVPVKSQPFLVKTAMKMQKSDENGLASVEEMATLYAFSDSVESVLKEAPYTFAGSFTQEEVKLSYFYVSDTIDLRKELTIMYAQHYSTYTLGLKIEYEPKWNTYLEFLYPGEELIDIIHKVKKAAAN